VVALALVVGLVAGCGGSGSPTTNSSDSGKSSGGDGDSGGGDDSDEGFAWVPYGLKDPTSPIPGPWPAYNAFAQHDCSELQSQAEGFGDLGKAMVAVCLAVVEGRQDQWEVAKALAAEGASSNDCLNDQVKGLLVRALAWHQRHPGRKPTVRVQRVAGQTECGRKATSENPTEESTSETTTSETTTSETTG
jgi:hypothetical protein